MCAQYLRGQRQGLGPGLRLVPLLGLRLGLELWLGLWLGGLARRRAKASGNAMVQRLGRCASGVARCGTGVCQVSGSCARCVSGVGHVCAKRLPGAGESPGHRPSLSSSARQTPCPGPSPNPSHSPSPCPGRGWAPYSASQRAGTTFATLELILCDCYTYLLPLELTLCDSYTFCSPGTQIM